MNFKPIKRDWVKNAAIIFLAILLVLTFFSNTIMNRSLPEVATQEVTDGSITAKVRGTGTVTATGIHAVKPAQTRVIRSVMVKAGQEVEVGDVLFVLGEGDSEEIEQAQETLRNLQLNYQRTALGGSSTSYASDQRKIDRAYENMKELEKTYKAEQKKLNSGKQGEKLAKLQNQLSEVQASIENKQKNDLTAAQTNLDNAKTALEEAKALLAEKQETLDGKVAAAKTALKDAQKELERLENLKSQCYEEVKTITDEEGNVISTETTVVRPDGYPEDMEGELKKAKDAIASAEDALAAAKAKTVDEKYQTKVDKAQAKVDSAKSKVDEISESIKTLQAKAKKLKASIKELEETIGAKEAYKKAKAAYEQAYDEYMDLVDALNEKKAADGRSAALTGVELQDLAQQIEIAKQKLDDLSGGTENQITSKVSGVVQSIDCASGDTKGKDDVLCTIEVPDMGYNLSFSVTNDQARRLKLGDSAAVSNYYWGSQIVATLSSIATDPKNPSTNKLLTFDVTGDVNAGSELTISVGQKSATYDTIIPNSAIRSDANGSFVLAVDSRSSPLGNRYIARRVNVEILAEDDLNSAVTGDLSFGDFVITTSNAPVKNGDMVRLADNA